MVDGAGAGEGVGASVGGKVVADAGEGFIEVALIKWFASFKSNGQR